MDGGSLSDTQRTMVLPLLQETNIRGRPYVTVSSKGIANGLSRYPNDGADFGPDTTLGATAPGQYGSPYTETSGVQEGVNFIPNGGIVKLGDGHFIISETITVASYAVTIEGTGYGDTGYATEITVNGNIDGFDFTTGYGGAVKNMFIQGSGSTSSAAINHTSTAGQGFRVENVRIGGFYNGIVLTSAGNSFVNNILFGTITGSAITVNGGYDVMISNCLGGGTSSTYALNGINLLDTGAFWILNCDFTNCSTGLNIAPPSGSMVVNGFVYGLSCDTGNIGMYMSGQNGLIQSITFVNCWTSSNSNSGGIIENGTPTGLTFIGLRAILNGKEGWYIIGGTEIEFDDCFFIANNTTNSPQTGGVGSGLEFSGLSASIYRVKGGKSTNSSSFGFSAGYQQYGITIGAATMEQYSIIGVDVTGNLSVGISDSGTATVSKILKDNLGFNPTGLVGVSTPAIGASGATYTNNLGYPVRIYVLSAPSGTTYNILGTHGNNLGSAVPMVAGQQITLDNDVGITVFYTTAPTWRWYGGN